MFERVQQGKRTADSLKEVLRSREVSMEIKRLLHDSVVVPVLTYGIEAWNM